MPCGQLSALSWICAEHLIKKISRLRFCVAILNNYCCDIKELKSVIMLCVYVYTHKQELTLEHCCPCDKKMCLGQV